jgi:hypothetical protein
LWCILVYVKGLAKIRKFNDKPVGDSVTGKKYFNRLDERADMATTSECLAVSMDLVRILC